MTEHIFGISPHGTFFYGMPSNNVGFIRGSYYYGHHGGSMAASGLMSLSHIKDLIFSEVYEWN